MTEQPQAPQVAQPTVAPANTKVMLDLDAETREDAPEPYVFALGGRALLMADPVELDWQEIADIESEKEWLQLALSDEDYDFFITQKLPAWKMRRLVKDYQEHYGIEEPGKAG